MGIGAAIAGVGAAAVGMGFLVKRGFDEFNEAQKVTAQTNAVLKSTKGVANVTGKEVERLGDRLSRLSGVDDEVIRSGSNMLLTFKQIRNEAGKGNDIFNQATKATLDLSVAMGTDMSKSAIMVGKALNDPIKGLTAMRRVGIQFTKAQEDQIKALVEAGDVMGAQKVILKELESQFGGSAKAAGDTLGGQLNKLRNRFDELAARVFSAVLPALNQLLGVALDLFPLIERFGGQAVQAVSNAFGALAGKAEGLGISLRDVLGGAWRWIQKNVVPIIQELRSIWVAAVTRIAAVLKKNEPELRRIWERVGAAVRALAAVALPILRFVFTQVLPRAINVAIKVLDKFTAVLASVVRFVRGAFNAIGPVFRSVGNAAQRAFGVMSRAATSAVSPLRVLINMISALVSWARAAVNMIGRLASAIRNIPRPSLPDLTPGFSIPGLASGVRNFAGGLAMVGERGPELVHLPRGSSVTPNHRLAAAGDGGGYVQVIVVGGNKPGIDWIQGLDRDYRRANGGRGLLG